MSQIIINISCYYLQLLCLLNIACKRLRVNRIQIAAAYKKYNSFLQNLGLLFGMNLMIRKYT